MIRGARYTEGHYTIKRINKLPKKGNANWLFILRNEPLDRLYRWDVNEQAYEEIPIIASFNDTSVYNDQTGSNKNKIGEYINSNSVVSEVFENLTSIRLDNNNLIYTGEDNLEISLDLSFLVTQATDTQISSASYDQNTSVLTLTLNNGSTITVSIPTYKSAVTNTLLSGNRIATHDDGDGSSTDINETITGLQLDNNDLTYTKEDGSTDDISLEYYDFRLFGLGVNNHDVTVTDLNDITLASGLYKFASTATGNPVGSSGALINLKSGANGYITQFAQFINAGDIKRILFRHYSPPLANWSTWTEDIHSQNINTFVNSFKSIITNTLLSGNRIATHEDGDGSSIDINETITSLQLSGNDLIYTKEDGTTDTIPLTSLGGTDLTYVASPSQGEVQSSSGTNAIIPVVDGTNAGLLKPDYYEEGTFTPTVVSSQGDGVYTATVDMGRFIRTGNVINFQIRLSSINTTTVPTSSSSRLEVDISGLPLTEFANGFNVTVFRGGDKVFSSIKPYLATNNRIAFLITSAASSTTGNAMFQVTMTNGEIYLSGSYLTNVYTH